MKKFYLPLFWALAALIAIYFAAGSIFAQEKKNDEKKTANEELKKIEKRAAELAPLLAPGGSNLIPPISDRVAWERLAKIGQNAKIITQAEKLLGEPIPECPEELYKEFFKNGNRSRAQHALGARGNRLRILAQAEILENKGRFLPALEEMIRDYCAYPSWVLPAHDPNNASIYDGQSMSADLVATHAGASVAIIRRAMLDVLSPEVADLMAENVKRRVLDPYEKAVREGLFAGMWWIRTTNNWNSVCHNGTLGAALALYDDPSKRAWFLAASELFVSDYFFRGFTEDGYCSEGMSYWNYGYGNFAQMAEIALRVTDGTVNLFDCPKAVAASWFAPKMEIVAGFYAAFADCPVTVRPSGETLSLLSRRQGMGLEESGKFSGWPNDSISDWLGTAVNVFPPKKGRFDRQPSEKTVERPWTALRSEFADAGILIVRAPIVDVAAKNSERDPAQLSAVFKGGNNGEHHNHNDLGSYNVLYGKNWMVLDPGGEIYTRRTFSSRRYEGELLNSFGHPVPRIAGKLQSTGSDAKAVVLERAFSDERDYYKLDLTSAYPVEGLRSASRAFEFTREAAGRPNRVTVTDAVEFDAAKPNVVETAVVTFAEWEKVSENETKNEVVFRLRKGDDRVVVTVRALKGDGKPAALAIEEKIVGENDDQVPRKPTRLGLATVEPVEKVTISTEIRPEPPVK